MSMAMKKKSIAVAEGDGIGPEIMHATLRLLDAAGAELDIHKVEIGEKVYLQGHTTGIEKKTWDILRQCGVFLKAPITTPQGGGFKSLNVTIRTAFGLYANVRPCVSYSPFVDTKHPDMDVVIIRENEEDLYTGIEYRQTPEVYQALKIITRPGCERIIRYAFEYARQQERKKVTCFTKDNILKLSDGLFHKVFDEIAAEYPDIQNEHWIIDIGAAKLADTPNAFDVIVMANLYGDILSDVAAQIAGSVGLAGSANIGLHCSMFEAIHGSAPRRAGQNVANPSGLILASVMMLIHLQQPEIATLIHNSWLRTLEEGIHTYDIYKENVSKVKVGTKEFTDAVIARLGKQPEVLKPVHYVASHAQTHAMHGTSTQSEEQQELVGVDVFVHAKKTVEEVHSTIDKVDCGHCKLTMIANRGVKVWPEKQPETLCVDLWRCRFLKKEGSPLSQTDVIQLLHNLTQAGLLFTQTEHLYTYNKQPGF